MGIVIGLLITLLVFPWIGKLMEKYFSWVDKKWK